MAYSVFYGVVYSFVGILGLVIGSFLNVCIYRIPKGESIVLPRSHCTACENVLPWYDLIPVISFIHLRGECRNCKEHISIQYPMIELINGIGYVWIFLLRGWKLGTILDCILFSILLVISVIDIQTFLIPVELNLCIALIGIIHIFNDWSNWLTYVIGAISVSGFLLILYLCTRGRGIGGGDIKLMAASGLLLGTIKIVIAFFFGCVLAAGIHLLLMKLCKKGHQLAFGPYLSGGIIIALLYGDVIADWYLGKLI